MAQVPRNSILVVGIYLQDRENTAASTVEELNRSREWSVEQRWIALGQNSIPADLQSVTVERAEEQEPKFTLLNRQLAAAPLAKHAYVILADDDIGLPTGFLDSYLIVRQYDFSLAQPARTHDSYIDHGFVEQLDRIKARWTRFVEIGPLLSLRHDAVSLLVPFDEASPRGWGYDFVWPKTLGDAGLKLGIVDATPIQHRLPKPVTAYSWDTANSQMEGYLKQRSYLSKQDAFFIVGSYV